MKVTIDHGVLRAESGCVVGLVTALEVETLDPLTPTKIRALTACPYCKAPQRHHCYRWRGGARKANHSERVDTARSML